MRRLWKWMVLVVIFIALYLAFEGSRVGESEYWLEQGDFARAASAAPMTYEAQMKIARAAGGDFARAAYSRVLEIEPESLSARLGRARGAPRQYQVANADLDYLVRKRPTDARAWAARAQYRAEALDLRGALSDVEKALALDPGNEEYSALKGLIETGQENPDAAFIDMLTFVTKRPEQDAPKLPLHRMSDFPSVYLSVALQAEEFQAAKEYIEDGLAKWRAGGAYRGGSSLLGLITLAECERRLGDEDTALRLVDQITAGLESLASSGGYLAAPSTLPDLVPVDTSTPHTRSQPNFDIVVSSPDSADILLRVAHFEKALILETLGLKSQAQAELIEAYERGSAEWINSIWREITRGAFSDSPPIGWYLPGYTPESTMPGSVPMPPGTSPER